MEKQSKATHCHFSSMPSQMRGRDGDDQRDEQSKPHGLQDSGYMQKQLAVVGEGLRVEAGGEKKPTAAHTTRGTPTSAG